MTRTLREMTGATDVPTTPAPVPAVVVTPAPTAAAGAPTGAGAEHEDDLRLPRRLHRPPATPGQETKAYTFDTKTYTFHNGDVRSHVLDAYETTVAACRVATTRALPVGNYCRRYGPSPTRTVKDATPTGYTDTGTAWTHQVRTPPPPATSTTEPPGSRPSPRSPRSFPPDGDPGHTQSRRHVPSLSHDPISSLLPRVEGTCHDCPHAHHSRHRCDRAGDDDSGDAGLRRHDRPDTPPVVVAQAQTPPPAALASARVMVGSTRTSSTASPSPVQEAIPSPLIARGDAPGPSNPAERPLSSRDSLPGCATPSASTAAGSAPRCPSPRSGPATGLRVNHHSRRTVLLIWKHTPTPAQGPVNYEVVATPSTPMARSGQMSCRSPPPTASRP